MPNERCAGQQRYAIATTKDRASTLALLAAFGLAGLFPPALIFDKETWRKKSTYLRAVAVRLALPLADLTLLDDKVNHLEDVASLGVRCILAGWGCSFERERRRARSLGFAVASADDLETTLFGD